MQKTPEDEAFDDLAKRQGAWGGGFPAKRQSAIDKINAAFDEEYIKYRVAFPKEYTAASVLGDQVKYGTSWSKDGERIDPMSVYKEPAQKPVREALAHLKATISAFGSDEGISLDQKGWGNLHAAIQTVVTQPAQEPAEWSWVCNECGAHEFLSSVSESDLKFLSCGGCGCDEFHKENTASPPRPWVGLTDEDIGQWIEEEHDVLRWAEAKLKEKNT